MHWTAAKKNQVAILIVQQHKPQINWDYPRIGRWKGTSAVCLSLIYQLHTMDGVIKDTTVPLVYSLLRNKDKKRKEVFAATKKFNAMQGPHDEAIDSEIAVSEALKTRFSNAIIKGCVFYLQKQNGAKFKALDGQNNTDKTLTHKFFSSLP